jgi:hypothetical protein
VVKQNESPLAGVTISGSGNPVTTDDAGSFEFSRLTRSAELRLLPELDGYTFAPEMITIQASGPSTIEASFSASAKIAPVVTCVRTAGNGERFAYFGYITLATTPLSIPQGSRNRVTPAGAGLVTEFLSGPRVVPVAFIASLANGPVQWRLLNQTANSEGSHPACGAEIQCPSGLTMDRCGICGGDGTACLGCSGQSIAVQVDSVRARTTTIVNALLAVAAGPSLPPRKVLGLINKIGDLGASIDLALVRMGSTIATCTNAYFCHLESLQPQRSAIQKALNGFENLVPLNTGNSATRRNLKKVDARISSQANAVRSVLKTLPQSRWVCD